MSITDLMPIRISLRDKPTGKRRGDDAVDLLQCKLIGAQLLIKGLRLQLDDQDREHEATIARIDERHGEVVRGLEEQIAELERRLGVACQANAAADLTQEIDTRDLQQRFATGRVVALQHSPQAATDPAHVPSWAVRDDEPEPAA
jgi:hypothetical protein